MELADRRVRSAEDISTSLGLPVLAELKTAKKVPERKSRFAKMRMKPAPTTTQVEA
jgi:hypothetical protein